MPRPRSPRPVTYQGRLRPVWVVLDGIDRPAETVRSWAKTMRVTSACDLRTGELLVDVIEVRRLHEVTPTRRRRRPDT